jgi:hypothetical protein
MCRNAILLFVDNKFITSNDGRDDRAIKDHPYQIFLSFPSAVEVITFIC